MQRVSSNLTLVLKVFVPTLWITFFGLMTVAVLFAGEDNFFFAQTHIKLIFLVSFLVFLALIYFTVMRLLRVEFGEGVFTASNYFKTLQYTFDDIDDIIEYDMLIKKLVRIKMKGKTQYGSSIYFLASQPHYREYKQKHRALFED